MNSAAHLQSEDRPEFERILDEALGEEYTKVALATARQQLSSEQLRSSALMAAAAISATAATEYQHYRAIRDHMRAAAGHSSARRFSGGSRHGASPRQGAGTDEGSTEVTEPTDVTESVAAGAAERTGAGLIAVVAVLAPILAGLAGTICLAVGYSLRLISPEPPMAAPFRTAGWAFVVLAAAGTVVGMVAVVLTALRNPSADKVSSRQDRVDRSAELAAAHAAWRAALLERGVRPYLYQALAGEIGQPTDGPGDSRQEHAQVPARTPRLGYSRPGFSSPNPKDPTVRQRGEEFSPEFTGPDFSSPAFSSPDFSSPDLPDLDTDDTDSPSSGTAG